MSEKPLPDLWVWNGQHYDEEKLLNPDFSETSARLKPLSHGRNELYISARKLRALLDSTDFDTAHSELANLLDNAEAMGDE